MMEATATTANEPTVWRLAPESGVAASAAVSDVALAPLAAFVVVEVTSTNSSEVTLKQGIEVVKVRAATKTMSAQA